VRLNRHLQAALDQLYNVLRGLNPLPGFLLKAMQHVDGIAQFQRINRAVGVAVVVLDNFQDARSAKASQGLGVVGTT
jgi:hypothetical protein